MPKSGGAAAKERARAQPSKKRSYWPIILLLGVCAAFAGAWQFLWPALQFDRQLQQADEWECKEPCTKRRLYGNRSFTYSPSRGFYPSACRWREVNFQDGERELSYEYWHSRSKQWSTEQPAACTLMSQVQMPASCSRLAPSWCTGSMRLQRMHNVRSAENTVPRLWHPFGHHHALPAARHAHDLDRVQRESSAMHACRQAPCQMTTSGRKEQARKRMAPQPRLWCQRTRTSS